MGHVGSSSLIRDQTQVTCIESVVSYPLDHQGSPTGAFIVHKDLEEIQIHCALECSIHDKNFEVKPNTSEKGCL